MVIRPLEAAGACAAAERIVDKDVSMSASIYAVDGNTAVTSGEITPFDTITIADEWRGYAVWRGKSDAK
jgi:hypothetical protein